MRQFPPCIGVITLPTVYTILTRVRAQNNGSLLLPLNATQDSHLDSLWAQEMIVEVQRSYFSFDSNVYFTYFLTFISVLHFLMDEAINPCFKTSVHHQSALHVKWQIIFSVLFCQLALVLTYFQVEITKLPDTSVAIERTWIRNHNLEIPRHSGPQNLIETLNGFPN